MSKSTHAQPLNHPWRKSKLSKSPGGPKSTSNGHNLLYVWRKERKNKARR
jgi:hypothetical protein